MKFYGNAFQVFSELKQYLQDNEIKKNDEGWIVTVKKHRDIKTLRKYWKMCDIIGRHIGIDKDSVSSQLLISVGHCRELPIVNDKNLRYVMPKSISFEKLSESEFEKLYKEASLNASLIWDLPDDINLLLNDLM